MPSLNPSRLGEMTKSSYNLDFDVFIRDYDGRQLIASEISDCISLGCQVVNTRLAYNLSWIQVAGDRDMEMERELHTPSLLQILLEVSPLPISACC